MTTILCDITSTKQFAEEARDVVEQLGMINAVELHNEIGGEIVRVFDLLEACGCNGTGDERIDRNPPWWIINQRHSGETIMTQDARWALCCFIRAYTDLINEIEEADGKLWDGDDD